LEQKHEKTLKLSKKAKNIKNAPKYQKVPIFAKNNQKRDI